MNTWAFDAILKMVTRHDHPLSAEGLSQARRLEGDVLRCLVFRRICQGSPGAGSEMEGRFLAARVVLCSPLTRAIQTATVGLRPLLKSNEIGSPQNAPPCVRLIRDIRERRNLGGRDTVGTCRGPGVQDRTRRCLRKVWGEVRARNMMTSSATSTSVMCRMSGGIAGGSPGMQWSNG